VDMSFSDRFVDLVADGYDLAIRSTADELPGGLISRPLRPMSFVFAASKEYLQRCGVPRSPEDLANQDCIMIGNGHSWPLKGPNGSIEAPARVVLRFESMSVAVTHAVCAGIGLAPLPRMAFEDPMFKDVLIPVLTQYPFKQQHIYAVYVSRQQLPLKIRTFVDHLVEFSKIQRPWQAFDTASDPSRSATLLPLVSDARFKTRVTARLPANQRPSS
jgi:DNA-binding transcriptional LysR family regulator